MLQVFQVASNRRQQLQTLGTGPPKSIAGFQVNCSCSVLWDDAREYSQDSDLSQVLGSADILWFRVDICKGNSCLPPVVCMVVARKTYCS